MIRKTIWRAQPGLQCWSAADALRGRAGIDAIHGALIDDCALAVEMKKTGIDLARPHRPRAQHPALSGLE